MRVEKLKFLVNISLQRQVWLIPIADERVGVQVKLWNPLRTRAIPERFCGGDSLWRGVISSVWKCVYLRYYGMLIGSRMLCIKPYHFRWLWEWPSPKLLFPLKIIGSCVWMKVYTVIFIHQWCNYIGFSAHGGRSNKVPPPHTRDVGITPTVRFSVKGTLWLPELRFFCKVTTSKFTAKLHHINA